MKPASDDTPPWDALRDTGAPRHRRLPRATYRVQMTPEFAFAELTDAIPYLARLGISHLYLSPIFRSRSGSQHGYDVTNHAELNPELGGADGMGSLVEACRRHAMGIILDIVPNHMAVMTADNAWWMDVLENGPASRFAHFFDIDWNPVRQSMRNRLLVPALDRPLGEAIAQGDIRLCFDPARGAFRLVFASLQFPVDPASYPLILRALEPGLSGDGMEAAEFISLVEALDGLPKALPASPETLARREREKEVAKRRLAELCDRYSRIARHVEECVGSINSGAGGEPMARLLAAQPYRLAYWRVAGEEVNYRRFFDVDGLAALRMEEPEVFDLTHTLVRQLWNSRSIDGLRVDHADGLFRPGEYLHRLRNLLSPDSDERPYLVVEKILEPGEELPEAWPVDGTTGYEFGALLTGWLLHPEGAQHLERIHDGFAQPRSTFAEIVYDSKKRVMQTSLAAEITMLAQRLDRIAQSGHSTSDFTLFDLRQAVVEVVACFPVYRTYISESGVTDADVTLIRRAVGAALGRKQTARRAIEYLRSVLLGEDGIHQRVPASLEFCQKFQQVTGPVMAKGVEDTAFYRYSRLLALNEVGGDPAGRPVSMEVFHLANARRAERYPNTLLATSTHDSKRGEDVRFRLCALSEVADSWRTCLGRWRRLKRKALKEVLPEPEMEYLLLQTALGIWPAPGVEDQGAGLRTRLADYAIKAAREAKVATSWLDPDADYEELLRGYVHLLVPDSPGTGFARYFAPVIDQVSYLGALNSVAAMVIKFTVPGIPDIYQGNESLRHVLVDPDNRGAVDLRRRDDCLREIQGQVDASSLPAVAGELLARCEEGRLKTFVTWRLLQLRRDGGGVFADGGYLAIPVRGECADHVMAYERSHQGRGVIVAVARWLGRLGASRQRPPLGEATWQDTALVLPAGIQAGTYRDALTGQEVVVAETQDQRLLRVAELFAVLPFSVLTREVPEDSGTS